MVAIKSQQEAPVETPELLVKEWKLKKEPETLEKIYHCLKNYPIKWVEDFLENYQGLDLFTNALIDSNLLSDK